MFNGNGPMVDPRMAGQMMQGGVGGPSGGMGGPQIPQQMMPQQMPPAMQGGVPGNMQQAMQDPRVMAYLNALRGGMGR